MNCGQLGCCGWMVQHLVGRASNAAAYETNPCARDEMSGCKFGEDVVDELAALPGSCDDTPTGHGGTIVRNDVPSVTRITFPAQA